MASTITLQRTINRSQQFIRQSPLLFTALGSVSVGNSAGTGYALGDTITVSGGLGGTAVVTSITGGGSTGPVGSLALRSGGQGFPSALTNAATTGGTGTGLTVNTTTTYNDPAFSNADWVKQTILAPPFTWRWNRTSATPQEPTFTTVIGQTDYSVSLPSFGWIEKATVYDPNNGFLPNEMQVGLIYAADTQPNLPSRIAAVLDDGEGNITFRVFPAPDRVYNVVVESQNAASLFTSVTQTWDPIPDYLSYIYNSGFDARSYAYTNDSRYPYEMQLFYTQLAEVAEGLDSTQKNIWLTDKLHSIREMAKAQQGR